MTIATPISQAQARPKRRHAFGRNNRLVNLLAMDVEQLADLAVQLDGAPVPGVRMSEDEFVEWAFDHVDAEWADGEVILMAPGNEDHETIDEWLGRLLGEFIERRGSGKFLRNMFVHFARKRRRRVPDLMFISAER